MSEPPTPPGGDQPPQSGPWHGQQPQQPEDTQQLPPHSAAGQPYAGSYAQPTGDRYNPYGQPSAGNQFDRNRPPPGPPGGGTPQYGRWQPQPPHPQQKQRRNLDANPLRAAFDFGFNSYATPGLVKIIYVLAAILAGIWWIGGALAYIFGGGLGSGYGAGGLVVVGIFWLLLGWIPALLWLLFVRIVLEASLALVRVADDTRNIRDKVGG